MTALLTPYVFDTGPLSHFAQAGWLGLLQHVVGEAEAWLPASVRQEVTEGVLRHAHLRSVLEADWLLHRTATSAVELAAFGRYAERMLGDDQRTNLGECEVLALAEAHRGVAVVDDGVARTAADERHVTVVTSVGMLCELVRSGHVSLALASSIADSLLRTEYRLPFDEGGFRQFVMENDYLPYEAAG
ncbi:nucleotide-binding protein [Cellulomonas sp. NPDC058312]|uniref:nucleotide-binding protein n=1 Tax=Cellulomonas sp. NPDC058312 TaxID=3346441 RepID=UPI0036E82AEA